MNNRRELRNAKRLRRRQRQRQASEPQPPPETGQPPLLRDPYAGEKSLRAIQNLLGDRQFESIEEANQMLQTLVGKTLDEDVEATPAERAQDLAFEAMGSGNPAAALRLARQALELDPNCVDALRVRAMFSARSKQEAADNLAAVAARAEELLGPGFIGENKGHFWGMLETRPFMRALQDLAWCYRSLGALKKAAGVYERMLELNPRDNQGVRYELAGLYLSEGRYDDLRRLLDRDPEDFGVFPWVRALLLWATGDEAGAREALNTAREANPYVEAYLSGARPIPRECPESYIVGRRDEAGFIAHTLAAGLAAHPGFRRWIKQETGPKG